MFGAEFSETVSTSLSKNRHYSSNDLYRSPPLPQLSTRIAIPDVLTGAEPVSSTSITVASCLSRVRFQIVAFVESERQN